MSKRILGIAACALLASTSQATLWEFMSNLSGLNEVPPNASPASGTSMGTYDDVTNMFMMDTSAMNFVAPVTAAHVHIGAPGVAGPVVFPLSGATGATTYTSHDMVVLTAPQEVDFLAGNWYVNIHSGQFPGGEVRGQLNPTAVPEPSTIVGLAIAAGVLLGLRRRR